jgi:predicted  nucleic acid-binding Zn-ribbon protein
VSAELSQLIELQELDTEIQRVTDRLARIPVEREQVESEFNQYAAEFLALKSKYEQTLEERKQLESELTSTQHHHEKYKQDLMRVRNTKEYETALREIDATKKQIGVLETEILRRMEEVERLDAELAVSAPDVERKRAEADLALQSLDQEREQSEHQLAAFAASREQLASRVPRQLFATYDRMARLRRGQALAELRDGICLACRMKVRPKVFSDVRKGDQMITCENCGRILYYRPASAQSAEAGASLQSTTE